MSDKEKSIESKEKIFSLPMPSKKFSLYDKDFYRWTVSQSAFLKLKEFSKLDIENLADEIESLGRSEKRALESLFRILLMHFLKKKYQPTHASKSLENSIKVSIHNIKNLLEDNPSLKRELNKILEQAYYSARLEAASETGLDESTFPENCPWTVEECMIESKSTGVSKKKKKLKKKSL